MASNDEQELTPTTETVAKQVSRTRILVIGKSGAGKSSLINKVFGLEDGASNAAAVSEDTPGEHDIEEEISFPSNPLVVIHDSEGFEAGAIAHLERVRQFISGRCGPKSIPEERLHAIWVCAEIPTSGQRLFETGVETLLKKGHKYNVPIIIVFTKADKLRFKVSQKLNLQPVSPDQPISPTQAAQIEQAFKNELKTVCFNPLSSLRTSIKHCVVVSAKSEPATLENLIARTLEAIGEQAGAEHDAWRSVKKWFFPSTRADPQGDSQWTWVEMTAYRMRSAQRVSPEEKIQACVDIGRKLYWRALFSEALVGFNMREITRVLHRDIVAVWNLQDTEKLLLKPDFLVRVLTVCKDVADPKAKNPLANFRDRALEAIVEHPNAILFAFPIAVILVIAAWLVDTHARTKNSIRLLVTFIVDLNLILDILFHLTTREQSPGPLSVALINRAFLLYVEKKRTHVHGSIRAWVETHWDTFAHVNGDVVVNRMQKFIMDSKGAVVEGRDMANGPVQWVPLKALILEPLTEAEGKVLD